MPFRHTRSSLSFIVSSLLMSVSLGSVQGSDLEAKAASPIQAVLGSDLEVCTRELTTIKSYSYQPSSFGFREGEDGSLYTEPFKPEVVLPEQAPMRVVEMPQKAMPSDEKVLMRLVPGKDGRQPVHTTALWPHRVHAQLMLSFPDGQYGGSGTLVGPHHILTVGHNVFSNQRAARHSRLKA